MLPRQQAETLSFSASNQCMACHAQPQALIGQSDAAQRLPATLSDPQGLDALHDFIIGSVQADGRVSPNNSDAPTAQTAPALWSLARDADRLPAVPAPDLRQAGIKRSEETSPDLRFNGTSLIGSLWQQAPSPIASAGFMAQSRTAGDTVSLTFSGTWINVGFLGSLYAGQAEVFIDGVSQGMIDTYRRSDQAFSRVFTVAGTGQHTLQIKVLGQRNANASDHWI